jgi:hypothetical protein
LDLLSLVGWSIITNSFSSVVAVAAVDGKGISLLAAKTFLEITGVSSTASKKSSALSVSSVSSSSLALFSKVMPASSTFEATAESGAENPTFLD